MAETAKWGGHSFVCSPTKLVPLMDLKATMAVKSESQDDSSGTSQTTVMGKEPEVISFSTEYLLAAGTDPWGQVEAWRADIGKINPLYIGGKQFGPAKLMLKNVEFSNILMANSGKFLGVKLSITLEEKVATTAKKTSSGSTSSNGTKKGAAEATAKVDEKTLKVLTFKEKRLGGVEEKETQTTQDTQKPQYEWHYVQSSDTANTIAKKYGTTTAKLYEWNKSYGTIKKEDVRTSTTNVVHRYFVTAGTRIIVKKNY